MENLQNNVYIHGKKGRKGLKKLHINSLTIYTSILYSSLGLIPHQNSSVLSLSLYLSLWSFGTVNGLNFINFAQEFETKARRDGKLFPTLNLSPWHSQILTENSLSVKFILQDVHTHTQLMHTFLTTNKGMLAKF